MTKTRLALLVLLLPLVTASAALADITIVMTVSMNGGPMPVNVTTTSYIKGLKMRGDAKVMEREVSVLVDAASKQQLMIDHGNKTVTVFYPKTAMANLPVTMGTPTITVKPSGGTRDILGRKCDGYIVEMSMPMTVGAETITMKMSGPAWVAKEGAGVAEYRDFYKAAIAAGLSASPLGQGPQGMGMDDVYKAFAEAGMPLLQEMQMSFEGTGQAAQMMASMSMAITMAATSVSTDPIPDEKFAIPAGYSKQ